MDFTCYIFPKELYDILHEKLETFTTVDDIIDVLDCNMIDFLNYNETIPLDELYIKFQRSRRISQLALNMYNNPNSFDSCLVLKLINDLVEDEQKVHNECSVKSQVTEWLCNFVKNYFIMKNMESKLKTIDNESLESKTLDSKNSLVPCKAQPNRKDCLTNTDFDILAQTLYKIKSVIYKSKILKSDKWSCPTCGLANQGAGFCEVCLSSSPYINKWKCEKCDFLNKITNEKCDLCRMRNENISRCRYCKKEKICADRNVCDKCIITLLQWKCWNPRCFQFNESKDRYCAKCGLQKEKSFNCLRRTKDIISHVWVCRACYTINDVGSHNLQCRNKHCHRDFKSFINFSTEKHIS